jgi:hypothetical protein
MTPLRRAGIGLTAAGERVTWSVAEGRRGRRWREAVVGERGLVHALLLETGPDGRFTHLELATGAGLLTLHPEGDGTLHGNVVTGGGIRHVTSLPWGDQHAIVLDGSPVCAATVVHRLRDDLAVGASARRDIVRIGTDLDLRQGPVRVTRLEPEGWRLDEDPPIAVDGDGLPVLGGGSTWPMEADGPG